MNCSVRGFAGVRSSILLLTACLAVCLAGCATGNIVQHLPDAPPPEDLSEPNYRQIIAEGMPSIFPDQSALGALQISGVRPVNHLRGRAWIASLRTNADSTPHEYALFILDAKIIDSRAGVIIDRCSQQTYESFDPTAFAPRTNAGRQTKPSR
jgi:hypothetical protein